MKERKDRGSSGHRLRRTLVVMAAVLLCLAGILAVLEFRTTVTAQEVVSRDRDRILAEMPELALTRQERELAGSLAADNEIQAAMEAGEMRELPRESALRCLEDILPWDAGAVSLTVSGSGFYADYQSSGHRVLISYIDSDGDGTTDLIQKYIAIPVSDRNQGAQEIYSLEYIVPLGLESCEKSETKRVWFSWLRDLWE